MTQIDLPVNPPRIGVAWTTKSRLGIDVKLECECNKYPGAQPFFTVSYRKGKKGWGEQRYTPFWDRALVLTKRFLADIQDPEALARRED